MDLDELLEALGKHAHRVLLVERHEELMPMYHLCTTQGPDLVIGTPWRDEDEKLIILAAIKAKAREVHAVALGFIGEMWMTKYTGPAARNIDLDKVMLPSQSPDRIECVMAMATNGKETKSRMWEIVRDRPEGAIIHLQKSDSDPGIFSGRMIDGLLPGQTRH